MSELRANTISDAAGTGPVTLTKQSAAKAWVFQSSTTGTQTAGGSMNVSSFTDTAVGDVDVNFINAMSGAEEYAGVGSNATFSPAADTFVNCENANFSRILTKNTSSTGRDDKFSAVFHGDLA